MENVKKAIVLDMDETLERGVIDGDEPIMMLRPNLDALIEKLKEAKEQSIDVILCTTAKQQWVDRFLNLKPEFKTVFDRILTRDNQEEWKKYSPEEYPLEYDAVSKDTGLINAKPVTTFGYNSVLFIDNSSIEGTRLKILFDITQGKLEKDVTFFSGYGYYPPNVYGVFEAVEAGKRDEETAGMVTEYLERLRNENGCLIMCSVIDDFMQKEYEPGLTLVDDKYKEEYREETDELYENIKEKMHDLEKKLGLKFYDIYDEPEVSQRFEEFFKTDKHYPYEGIEMSKSRTQEVKNVVEDVKLSDVDAITNETKQLMESLKTEEKDRKGEEKDGKD